MFLANTPVSHAEDKTPATSKIAAIESQFIETVTPLRTAWKIIKREEKDRDSESEAQLDKMGLIQIKGIEKGAFPHGLRYFLLAKMMQQPKPPKQTIESLKRCMSMPKASSEHLAAECFARSICTTTMAPECIFEFEKINANNPNHRSRLLWLKTKEELEACFGTLIPISGKDSDRRQSADIKPRRLYDCPCDRSQGIIWIAIAAQFEELKHFDDAWRAYIEAGYLAQGYARWNPDSKMWERSKGYLTWEEDERSLFWCRAAICAHKAGKKEIAMHYLAKAATFGSDELFTITKQIHQKWKNGKEVKPSEYKALTLYPPLEEKSLTQIVKLYMGLNAHPRAWMIIDQYPTQFENSAKLRKEVQKDWLDLLKVYRYPQFAYVKVYGYQIFPLGDPLAVSIPWPFSKKTLECVSLRCICLPGNLTQSEKQKEKPRAE